MPKFSFRLQKVLEFRELEEGEAQNAYRAAQDAVSEKQADIRKLILHRTALVSAPAPTIDARLHLERVMERIDDEERTERSILAILENEETIAEANWNAKRQAVKVIEKLRENALEAWKQDEERREQADLDEWAVLRRAA
ncbi:MAG: flagellar export protein FliJ [Fimbriimonas sp.]